MPATQKAIIPSTNGNARQGVARRFSLQEFEQICHVLLNDRLELVNGEILISPVPDKVHIQLTMQVGHLLHQHFAEIHAMGCRVADSSAWYFVPDQLASLWVDETAKGADYVCPDVSICYPRYWERKKSPPALLVVEVLSVSCQTDIERDLVSKPDIYAALAIPAYWVIDRRDKSVWVHTAPEDGKYTKCVQYKGRKKLPAPGLEFLTITPAQIFAP